MEAQEEIERWVLSVCEKIGLRAADVNADFFEAGGNSLAAMKIISQAEETFGEDALPPDDLFSRSTVREIAACILANSGRAPVTSES
ncbi:acyl carrier protein [Streptomyces natalensis]|uniref:Carrier domain-containing protein n=1 Tax=Streptomyces natalensis ATCC 27448 TaxID=1240678 RepID=A0A0D7CMW8_9ACTN|nr:acyl carrier protein [Streptomyces natalensis]KIZ17548.1 hypothetical protein SNA_13720 [Streptomyces natalensis ATCC 27448]